MKLLIAGDTVPTQSNFDLFQNGDVTQLVGDKLLDIIHDHEYFVLNLETPLIESKTPIQKSGPVLGAPQNTIKGYKHLQVNAVSMANNHMMDHGKTGLCSTLKALNSQGIAHFGAGLTFDEASKCHFATIDGVKLGFYSCCEHEFSVFTPEDGGANGYDPLVTFDEIRRIAGECDHLIVLYHGGKEEYRYPTPLQQRIMRKMAECGARLVIAQHSHCIGCWEDYKGSRLIYGQGNFLFDLRPTACWNNGLIFSVCADKKSLNVKAIPVVRENNHVRKASDEEAKAILDGFAQRSQEIQKEGFVTKTFEQKARKERSRVLRKLHGNTMFMKVITKVFPNYLNKFYYSGANKLAVLNQIRCESHHETLETILRMK